MTVFADFEVSAEAGEPVELYVFKYQSTTLFYTTDASDFVSGSQPYANAAISRSEFEDTGDIAKADLTITAPPDFPVSMLFAQYPPSDVVTLTVYRVQRSVPLELKVWWKGRVLNATWQGGNSQLSCSNLYSAMRAAGIRKQFSRLCTHVHYGKQCTLDIAAFTSSCTVESVTGITIVSSDFALSPGLAGGRLDYEISDGVFEFRLIKTHAGDTITITYPIVQLQAAAIVKASQGCDHTRPTCKTKFGNLDNHGGFPDLPQLNPYSTSVF